MTRNKYSSKSQNNQRSGSQFKGRGLPSETGAALPRECALDKANPLAPCAVRYDWIEITIYDGWGKVIYHV